MENEPANSDTQLPNRPQASDDAIVTRLITHLNCPVSECLCEYDAGHLVSLHIRYALSIDHLPPDIASLRHLRTLRLTGQWKLTSLPPALGQLERLEILELSGCRLSSLPPEIGQLSNLHTLRVQDTHALTQIPSEFGRLASLSMLSLAGNRLTSLPSAIGHLEKLVVLDCSSNELRHLPPEIGQMRRLSHLDLSYNLLTHLPADLGQLSTLETLRLEHNDLNTLPPEIGQLPNLENLTLDWNRLIQLSPQIGRLTRLLTLSLEHNQLASLPEELALLPRLEDLNLAHNQLNTLPQALTHLPHLHPLTLDGNPLEQVTTEFLTRLTTFSGFAVEAYRNAAGSELIPERVQDEEIWLEGDRFYLIDSGQSQLLPRILADLPSTPIDINLNQVTLLSSRQQHYVWARLEFWKEEPPLPTGSWDLASDSEKTLYLTAGAPDSGSLHFCDALSEKLSKKHFALGEANKYYHIRVFCRRRAAAREAAWDDGHPPRGYEQYLFQFWLYRPKASGRSFASLSVYQGLPADPSPLPEDGKTLGQMAARLNLDPKSMVKWYRDGHLVELGFGNNQSAPLREFPTEFLRFTHLSTLYLGGQQLTSLWPEIGQLTTLQTLYLGDNRLTTLPPEIGLLANLKSLSLNENHLTTLPLEIGQLSRLENLEVNKNHLTTLPPEIGQLTRLNNLKLDSNQFSSLPPEIGQLSHLKELHLNWNQLHSLPPEIGHLTSLTQLVLTRNPLQSLPAEIGQLTNLRTLVVRESFALAYLPPEMCSLKALQTLDLEYNNLQYLPREIGRLRKLATLSLSGNWLQELPRQMGQLPHLTHLNLSSNRITELPREIDQLISLTSLRLDEPLLNALPARLQELIDTPRRPERNAIFFETGPYYDRSGHGQSPRRLVCNEINVDYSQFLLQDAHTHLECEQQGTVDNWIQISEHGIVFLSAAQYHYAWVRMEAWEDEPPAIPGSWEITSELTLAPHSGIVMLAELMGGWSASLELMPGKEPGCPYRMRACCRGRETLAEFFTIQREDDEEEDPIPHGLEQYLLQFWPL